MSINTTVKKWLAKHFSTNQNNISSILKDEQATSYLLIWSVFEKEIFDGYMKNEKIKDKAKYFSDYYNDLNVEEIVQKFYNRYQDKKLLKNLRHKDRGIEIESILSKDYLTLSSTEKLQLLFYVSFRYRNNIFHGNKGVLSWTKFTEQINDCIKFMITIIDINKEKGGI